MWGRIQRGEKIWIQQSRICQNSKPSIKKCKENGATKATVYESSTNVQKKSKFGSSVCNEWRSRETFCNSCWRGITRTLAKGLHPEIKKWLQTFGESHRYFWRNEKWCFGHRRTWRILLMVLTEWKKVTWTKQLQKTWPPLWHSGCSVGVRRCAQKRNCYLFKKKTRNTQSRRFHPITVGPIIGRLFHRVLSRRMLTHWPLLNRQKAFRHGDGLADNIWLVKAITKKKREQKQRLNLTWHWHGDGRGGPFHRCDRKY